MKEYRIIKSVDYKGDTVFYVERYVEEVYGFIKRKRRAFWKREEMSVIHPVEDRICVVWEKFKTKGEALDYIRRKNRIANRKEVVVG